VNKSITHQQRWRARLRETHDRLDVYLPKSSAAALRRALTGKETVSDIVARFLESSLQRAVDPNEVVSPKVTDTEHGLSPETHAYAALRALQHGVSIDDFLLAAMRGVSGQTTVMIRGLAKVGRRDAEQAGASSTMQYSPERSA
jgi:hypothetical protein